MPRWGEEAGFTAYRDSKEFNLSNNKGEYTGTASVSTHFGTSTIRKGTKSRPQRILAIDPGTRCGWALLDAGHIVGGVWDLAPRRHEGGGMRFVHLRRFLRDIGPLDLVAYEEVRRHLGTDAAQIYGGIVGTLTAWAEEQSIPYEGVPVGTIKRHATGKGNADKAAMIEACQRRLSVTPQDDNEADARWILHYVMTREGLGVDGGVAGRSTAGRCGGGAR